MVHGVTEPSDEIKKDLVSVFQKRLDDYTLELITMALARNPNTKLALQDVQVRLVDLGDYSNDNCSARVCNVCFDVCATEGIHVMLKHNRSHRKKHENTISRARVFGCDNVTFSWFIYHYFNYKQYIYFSSFNHLVARHLHLSN